MAMAMGAASFLFVPRDKQTYVICTLRVTRDVRNEELQEVNLTGRILSYIPNSEFRMPSNFKNVSSSLFVSGFGCLTRQQSNNTMTPQEVIHRSKVSFFAIPLTILQDFSNKT